MLLLEPRGTLEAYGMPANDQGTIQSLKYSRAIYVPWSRPSGRQRPVPAAATSPKRLVCHSPSDRRRETTSTKPSGSDERWSQKSPIADDGSRIRRPGAALSTATPADHGMPCIHTRQASEPPPDRRYTPLPSQTARQNREFPTSTPPPSEGGGYLKATPS